MNDPDRREIFRTRIRKRLGLETEADPEGYDQEKIVARAGLHLLRLVLPTFLALLATVLLFNFLIMPRFVGHGSEVEVPDLTSRTLQDAGLRLAPLHLAIRDTIERESSSVPPGRIIDQDPRPGTHIKPQRSVLLVVSRGLGEQRVPAVKGQALRYARLTLNQEGYELGDVLRVPSVVTARDFVVASDPPEGDVLEHGGRVSLLVSDGPERKRWIMPDLEGRELQLTADKLRFAGFPVVVRESENRWRFGTRRVRATVPPPGAAVAEGDTIWLYGRR
jgi:beta-lactam-binding protein with PASTA domain